MIYIGIRCIFTSLPLGVGDGVEPSRPGGGYRLYYILVLGVSLPLGVGDGVGPSGPGVGAVGHVGILQHWSLGSVVMKQD